ncbi:LON peptidase substrate-binding domain-containing protein [Actinomadura flavalba]|uniref:LON peptidase substrate-binding domain-containing protein n=1 Tax=Actinomadura flavalba TaxID=1120938 RepID=UPI00036EE61D|nr:LON peptidase substrate-binding domain-containing protein [Actinomadura flavalba]
MTERVPLFPLGTVLFPGMDLPLRVFEDRYLALVRDVLAGSAPHRFGIVAVEFGHPVIGTPRIAEVGCVAEVTEAEERPDGQWALTTVGGARFRVKGVDRSRPYPLGETVPLPDEPGPDPEPLARLAGAAFERYRGRMAALGVALRASAATEPVALSHEIASRLVLDGSETQRLLAAEHAAERLRRALALLERENRLLRDLPALPYAPFADGSFHPN